MEESTPLRLEDEALRLHVWVVPGASRSRIMGLHGGLLKVGVASPPERGRANEDVIGLLEAALGVKVIPIRGMTSRHKVFEIPGHDVTSAGRKLGLAR